MKTKKLSLSKKYLAFICAVYFSSNLSAYAEFDLDDVNLESHRAHYNSLPSAKESDDLRKASPHFEAFLKKAEEVVTRYELESSIGLRLIHNHFTLGEGQVMAENYEEVEKVPSLVSSALSIEEAKEKKVVPASWILSGQVEASPMLFEASSDPAVKAHSLKLQQHPEFFKEMSKLLGEYKFNNLLSVGILQRESLVANENEWYRENTFLSNNRSVVQLWNIKEQPLEGYVRTSWNFEGPKKHFCICAAIYVCNPHGVCGYVQTHN